VTPHSWNALPPSIQDKGCISIYGIYITPLQGNYSEALPCPGKNKSFEELVKRAGQILWKRAEFRWETVPSRGTHNREALRCLMAVRA